MPGVCCHDSFNPGPKDFYVGHDFDADGVNHGSAGALRLGLLNHPTTLPRPVSPSPYKLSRRQRIHLPTIQPREFLKRGVGSGRLTPHNSNRSITTLGLSAALDSLGHSYRPKQRLSASYSLPSLRCALRCERVRRWLGLPLPIAR